MTVLTLPSYKKDLRFKGLKFVIVLIQLRFWLHVVGKNTLFHLILHQSCSNNRFLNWAFQDSLRLDSFSRQRRNHKWTSTRFWQELFQQRAKTNMQMFGGWFYCSTSIKSMNLHDIQLRLIFTDHTINAWHNEMKL